MATDLGTFGPYRVRVRTEQYRVFVKDKYDKTIPIRRLDQYVSILRVGNEDDPNPRTFKRYLWRGEWLWRDLWWNEKICIVELTDRIAKILFAGNRNEAKKLIARIQ
jgi:hypothetical protein